MSVLISAALANALGSGLPEEIVYLPEGDHQIKPWVDGKPQEVTVKVLASRGAEIAASLQSALDGRMKSNVRPWFDFEHKRGVASALPKAFRYEPGKGVMAAVEWTGAGKAAIEGKDFSYFSPVFLLGDDGVPDGLPERGPLGGLVNEPAFREIPRIAASDADGTTDTDIEQPPAMSKLIFAALAISAAAENAETEAVKAIDRLKVEASDAKAEADRLKAENAALTKKVEASDAAAATARKERADTLVKAAVADGRIAVKDTEKQDKFRAKIEAGDTFAEEILAQLPKQHAGLDKPLVTASGDKSGATSIDEKAKALVTAGDAKDLDEARGIIFASDAEAYSAYLASLKQ
jgi:phage I-like protein